MTRLGMVGMIIVTAMVMGCAAKQQPAPPPLRIVHEETTPPAPAQPPPPTAAEILAAQPSEVREAIKEYDNKGEWPSYRTRSYVLYPYGEGPQPVVDCAALRTTDIQLQPGETVTDLAIGDQERWMATPASSGDPRDPTPHIALKPQAPGIETNLTIYTTRHIYHLVLRSAHARDAGGRVLLSRGTSGGDAPGRRCRGEGEAAEHATGRDRSTRRQ